MNVTWKPSPKSGAQVNKAYGVKDIEIGQVFTGEFIESSRGEGPNGPYTLHKFHPFNEQTGEVDTNDSFGIYGNVVLNDHLEGTEAGRLVRITRTETPRGKNYYNFYIEFGNQ